MTPRPALAVALAAILVAGIAPLALAKDWRRKSTTIEGPRLRLTLSVLRRGAKHRFELTSLETKDGRVRFDLSHSPLFRAVLFDFERTGQTPVELDGPGPDGTEDLRARQISVRPIDGSAAEIRFQGMRIPGTGERLSLRARVDLSREDGAAQWTATCELEGRGSLAIGELRFPVLRVAPLGDPTDDRALIPLTGGLLLRNPVSARTAARVLKGPFGTASNYHYPGYIDSQLLAYYDPAAGKDGARGGLYLAAEDPDGYLKTVHATGSRESRSFEMLLGHYNYAPDPYETEKPRTLESLRGIDVGHKLPYPVVTRLFDGDWMDAADFYRAWMEEAGPVFLSRGPLHQRADVPPELRATAFGLGLVLSEGSGSVASPDPQQNPDLAALRDTKRYFTDDGGAPLRSSMTLVGNVGTGGPGNANDNTTRKLRPGLRSFLRHVHASDWGRSIVTLAMNRDIGNWNSESADDVEEMLAKGLAWLPSGRPQPRSSDHTAEGRRDRKIAAVTANCSQFVQARRIEQFRSTFARTMDGDRSLVTGLVLSGRGTQAHPCFGPLFAGEHLAEHHHRIGGGTHFIDGYRTLVGALRREFGRFVPHLLPACERGHEHLIDTSILAGRLRLHPYDVLFHGRGVWIDGGIPVPLLSYLYHDWALLGARLPRRSHVARAYAQSLGGGEPEVALVKLLEDPGFLTLERQRFAAAAIEGQRVGVYVEGARSPEEAKRPRIDGPPGGVPPGLDRNFAFLRELFRLRSRAVPWLVEGRMLRPPDLEGREGPVRLTVLGPRGREPHDLPRVLASAWRAPDGRLAVALVNYTLGDAHVALEIDARSFGLADAGDRSWRLVPERGEPVPLERTESGRLRSAEIAVTAKRPAVLLQVR